MLNKGLLAAALSAGVIVIGTGAGCESKAGTGALVGAGAGAGIGAIIGHNSHNRTASGAAIGAGVGAISGALIGNEMDKQGAREARRDHTTYVEERRYEEDEYGHRYPSRDARDSRDDDERSDAR
jgi:hypothetical protein